MLLVRERESERERERKGCKMTFKLYTDYNICVCCHSNTLDHCEISKNHF